jgi:ABC-2 type transport system permease protein
VSGFSIARVGELLRKELRQIFRDPQLYRILFVAPLVQLLIFGYAVSTDVRHTATFVVDHDRTAASRRVVDSLVASGYFDVVGHGSRDAEVVAALDAGRAVVGVVVPAGFGTALAAGEATVQLLVDGTNSNVATVALGQAEGILARLGAAAAPSPAPPAVELRDRAWYNPDLDSRDYNVPAVVGVLLFLVCLLLTALTVVREREIGTLEQLMVTPLLPLELIVGKALPFVLIGFVDLVMVTALARLWFDVPLAGSPLLLGVATLLFLLPSLGLGLLVSTVSQTQQEAFMASYLILVPAILLSGFMFPVRSMPPFFQVVSLANPLRHYLEIVRGIFLKGTGLAELWQQHLALLALGVVLLGGAAARFQKRLG